MPSHRKLPYIPELTDQLGGIFSAYQRMLDDEFMFASAMQVPQAATIFDIMAARVLPIGMNSVTFPELIALIAYRYGFRNVRRVGHGGYAVVFGHGEHMPGVRIELRRVLRLVPDHHVQDVMGNPDIPQRSFDVRVDKHNEPIRDPYYPLLLSDLFLLPRHTTKLIFLDIRGEPLQAGGKPAVLHCQLMPQVIPLNQPAGLDRKMADEAGDLLSVALASLGVSVSDAHTGNGGVLVDRDGEPLIFKRPLRDGTIKESYVPVVLDWGYYSEIGPRMLSQILASHGVTVQMVRALLDKHGRASDGLDDESQPLHKRFERVIREADLGKREFGRLLYDVDMPIFTPEMWIRRSMHQWETIKEQTYPALHDQSRLNILYPTYHEILFPQRVEEYRLMTLQT